MNRYNNCDKKKRTRTPYRPFFEAPETTVFHTGAAEQGSATI